MVAIYCTKCNTSHNNGIHSSWSKPHEITESARDHWWSYPKPDCCTRTVLSSLGDGHSVLLTGNQWSESVIASPVIPNKRRHRQLDSVAVLVDVYYLLYLLSPFVTVMDTSHMQSHVACNTLGQWMENTQRMVCGVHYISGRKYFRGACLQYYICFIIKAVCHWQLVFFCILCNGCSSW